MESFILSCLILLICLILLLIFVRKSKKSNVNFPPGPDGIPIFGSYFHLEPRAYLVFCELKKRYGDVFSIRVGLAEHIILTSYKSIKEALLEKKDNFSGRVKDKFFEEISNNCGIAFVDGALWQEHRRFSLQTLRNFGLGRNLSSEIILNEWDNLGQHLDARLDRPLNTLDILRRTVSNVICTMTFGEQHGYDPNDEFGEMNDKLNQMISTPLIKMPLTMFSKLYYLSPLIKCVPIVKKMLQNQRDMQSYIDKKIKEHRRTLDPNAEPRDFTDAYLLAQIKESSKSDNTFTDFQLMEIMLEMFQAGTDTTANSLGWAIFWMAIRPELQSTVQQEIDNTLDATTPIIYNDRTKLNLVQAVLDEVQRWATIAPYAISHRNFSEDTIQGYRIPANSSITPCLYAVHHDPEIWEKPEEFYPQHFLSDDGQHYKSRNELIPFSIGRRSCLGESLARMEYFILFTSIMRRYRVSLDPEDEKNLSDILLGTDGVIRSPGSHNIIFKMRD